MENKEIKIKWKKSKGGRLYENQLEGHVDGVHVFTIYGKHCVTDLRPINGAEWKPAVHYRIKDKEDGKRIAHNVINGLCLEELEENLRKQKEESERTIKIMKDAEDLLKKLKEKNNQ